MRAYVLLMLSRGATNCAQKRHSSARRDGWGRDTMECTEWAVGGRVLAPCCSGHGAQTAIELFGVRCLLDSAKLVRRNFTFAHREDSLSERQIGLRVESGGAVEGPQDSAAHPCCDQPFTSVDAALLFRIAIPPRSSVSSLFGQGIMSLAPVARNLCTNETTKCPLISESFKKSN